MSETYADTHPYSGLAGRFATIDYADAYEGYEWDQVHVLRGIDGHLYVGEGSGCSCYHFCDTAADAFTRVDSWQDAANKVRDWIDEDRESAGMQLIERLTATQPAAHIEIDPRNPWGEQS